MATWEATGPTAMVCLAPFERGRVDIGPERLRHALPDEEQRVEHADRQQDIKGCNG